MASYKKVDNEMLKSIRRFKMCKHQTEECMKQWREISRKYDVEVADMVLEMCRGYGSRVVLENEKSDIETFFEMVDKFIKVSDGDYSWLGTGKYWEFINRCPPVYSSFWDHVYISLPRGTGVTGTLAQFGFIRKE